MKCLKCGEAWTQWHAKQSKLEEWSFRLELPFRECPVEDTKPKFFCPVQAPPSYNIYDTSGALVETVAYTEKNNNYVEAKYGDDLNIRLIYIGDAISTSELAEQMDGIKRTLRDSRGKVIGNVPYRKLPEIQK